MNRGSEARDDIQWALERDPLNGFLYSGLAIIHYSMNECDELMDVIKQVIKIYPEGKWLIDRCTRMFYLCADKHESIIEFQPDMTAESSYIFGIAHANAGNIQEAKQISKIYKYPTYKEH